MTFERRSIDLLSHLDPSLFVYNKKAFLTAKKAIEENLDMMQTFIDAGFKPTDYVDLMADSPVSVRVSLADRLHKVKASIDLKSLLQRSLERIQPKDFDDFIVDFQRQYIEITGIREKESVDIAQVIEQYEKQQEIYSEQIRQGAKIIGHSCGIDKLDNVIDGLRPEHLWVIGAFTGVGKTFFALNILNTLIENKVPTAFYSLEMSKNDIVSRLLGLQTSQHGIKIMKGSVDDFKSVQEAKDRLKTAPLTVHSTTRTLDQLRLSILEQKLKNKVEVVFVDFAQLVVILEANNLFQSMSTFAHAIQDLAKEQKITIVLLSQLSNEAHKSNDSQAMGYKGAQDLEAAADLGIILKLEDPESRDEFINRGVPLPVKCQIKKNRHGAPGTIQMEFDTTCGRFSPVLL